MPQRIGTEANNFTATIALNQTVSNTIDCRKDQLLAIYIPATFTGTSISFQSSVDGVNYVTMKAIGSSSAYSEPLINPNPSGGQCVSLDPRQMASAQYVRIVSSSSEAGARSITCAMRPIS